VEGDKQREERKEVERGWDKDKCRGVIPMTKGRGSCFFV